MDGPHIRALVFGVIGACAAFGILWDLKRGVAIDGMWSFSAARSPAGFFGVVIMKLGFVALGVAELLFLLNLVGDPWVTIVGFGEALGIHAHA